MAQRQWLPAEAPFRFGLTPEGNLWIEFELRFGAPENETTPMGIVIPQDDLKALRVGLGLTQSIEQTLSAKPSPQGPH
jgi:hypothetical protein